MSLTFTSPFLYGTTAFPKPQLHYLTSTHKQQPTTIVCAAKITLGKVLVSKSDKTVKVAVTRLVQHPKYKARYKKISKIQAHDPENKYKKGDIVQLVSCRPISKQKAHLAVDPPEPPQPKPKVVVVDDDDTQVPQELGIPLQSQSVAA